MALQYINIVYAIWVKNISALKVKTTIKKPIHVAGGEIYNFQGNHQASQKYIYDNRLILCKWNTIPPPLSCNIAFTAVINLADRKFMTIFKAIQEIYMYCINVVFLLQSYMWILSLHDFKN